MTFTSPNNPKRNNQELIIFYKLVPDIFSMHFIFIWLRYKLQFHKEGQIFLDQQKGEKATPRYSGQTATRLP